MSVASYGKRFPILLQIPSQRGQVELLETIGKGNYGYVYKGRLVASQDITAVKVVFLKEDELRETLLEVEILKMSAHPNITKYMGSFLKGLDLWICMEFCGGGALDSLYRALRKPLTEDQIATIMYESLKGLDYLHNHVALIHRDIKAGNLLLTEQGELKLADFGVSAKLQSVGGRARTFIGTPYWMAPEVIMADPDSATSRSASYDCKADIWSIGITAIEIADKNPPLSDIHPMRALHLIPTSDLGLAKPKNWSKAFADFVATCLTKDPTKRPSAAQILEHPFLAKVKSLNRQKILADLVSKARVAREKKKSGQFDDDDDIEDVEDKREEVPAKAVAETMRQAQAAAQAAQSLGGLAQHPLPTQQQQQAIPQNYMSAQPYGQRPSVASQAQHTASDTRYVGPTLEAVGETKRRILDPLPLGGHLKIDVATGDILDGQYLLIGTPSGLFFIDTYLASDKQVAVPLIREVRFKQLSVLEDYGVMIALSGKHDHVRQYRLASIRKLIKYLLGGNAFQLAKANLHSGAVHAVANSAAAKEEEDDVYGKVIGDTVEDEAALVARWTGDYIKILATRDTNEFVVQRTETTVYMAVIIRQDITLFEWAREPYSRFMKLKAFWLPETPKFIHILHDGLVVREIFLGYNTEANLVNVEDSKVKELEVSKEFLAKAGAAPATVPNSKGARWQTWAQIPFSDAKRAEMRNAQRPTTTINRKIAAVVGPTTIREAAVIDRFFLATFGRHTRVVDINGQPMTGPSAGGWRDGVTWSEPSQDLMLRPVSHVAAVGNRLVEIADWKSGEVVQTLAIGQEFESLKVLASRPGKLYVLAKKRRMPGYIFCLREVGIEPLVPGSSVVGAAQPHRLDPATHAAQAIPPVPQYSQQHAMPPQQPIAPNSTKHAMVDGAPQELYDKPASPPGPESSMMQNLSLKNSTTSSSPIPTPNPGSTSSTRQHPQPTRSNSGNLQATEMISPSNGSRTSPTPPKRNNSVVSQSASTSLLMAVFMMPGHGHASYCDIA
ncbi:hypothetical protein SeLEV6574_g07856 [Synchytrium endobioticum]|uniref:non-specific serine/threonine protein kinase n=1 Tax=Synchytrium endobioticum TaxID=286115 RepID=A0A507CF80_9FUNG|nr:hypothetical protein SeLEV6574_g07856 [Synchytrium endobioticum]